MMINNLQGKRTKGAGRAGVGRPGDYNETIGKNRKIKNNQSYQKQDWLYMNFSRHGILLIVTDS
jgi:hypothetical protein